jgi:hypothetical protein
MKGILVDSASIAWRMLNTKHSGTEIRSSSEMSALTGQYYAKVS